MALPDGIAKWVVRQPVFDGLRAGHTAQQIFDTTTRLLVNTVIERKIFHLQNLTRWLRSDEEHAKDVPEAMQDELLKLLDREVAILQNPTWFWENCWGDEDPEDDSGEVEH